MTQASLHPACALDSHHLCRNQCVQQRGQRVRTQCCLPSHCLTIPPPGHPFVPSSYHQHLIIPPPRHATIPSFYYLTILTYHHYHPIILLSHHLANHHPIIPSSHHPTSPPVIPTSHNPVIPSSHHSTISSEQAAL